jgi:F-type H+-transporting ATPase subunit b
MLIDWFTVAAQTINFLVLVWLLKRFLYKPIIGAMDAREQRISAQLRDAETRKNEAEAQSRRFRDATAELEREKQALLSQAKAEAEAARQRLIEKAREETESLRLKWREGVREEEKALAAEITTSVQKEIFAITGRALRDLAGTELEPQIAAAFVRRLRELEGDAKEQLGTIVKKSNKPIMIRSAFDLPSSIRMEIERAVHDILEAEVSLSYEAAPEILGGVELTSNGCKISWSIAGYLSSLEEHIRQLAKQSSITHEQS